MYLFNWRNKYFIEENRKDTSTLTSNLPILAILQTAMLLSSKFFFDEIVRNRKQPIKWISAEKYGIWKVWRTKNKDVQPQTFRWNSTNFDYWFVLNSIIVLQNSFQMVIKCQSMYKRKNTPSNFALIYVQKRILIKSILFKIQHIILEYDLIPMQS